MAKCAKLTSKQMSTKSLGLLILHSCIVKDIFCVDEYVDYSPHPEIHPYPIPSTEGKVQKNKKYSIIYGFMYVC